MKTPYDKVAKMYMKYFGHMTKWPPRPYIVKLLNKSSSEEPKSQLPWDLVCGIEDVVPTNFVQMMILS